MDIEQQYEDHINRAARLLPAWFVPRMMNDVWAFGLLLTTGQILRITEILDVIQAADSSLWIDVTMDDTPAGTDFWGKQNHLYAPTSRVKASVNVAQIVAAFELADT
jgi:hypothetical protein